MDSNRDIYLCLALAVLGIDCAFWFGPVALPILTLGFAALLVAIKLIVRRSTGGSGRIAFVRDPARSARRARLVQVVWVAWLFYASGWLSRYGPFEPWLVIVFVMLHLVAALATFWNLRWAWLVSLTQAGILWLCCFAMFFALQVWAAIYTDHYADSPLTAWFALIYLMVTCAPASYVLWHAWRGRSVIFG